jgi:nitrite reductase (NADH) small subunit
MEGFIKSARASDIPPGTGRVFSVNGTPVAVFNVAGAYHAIHNNCLHRQGPLGEGELDGSTVTCPWHGWTFDVTSGECRSRPGARVACYEVRVEGEDIYIKA